MGPFDATGEKDNKQVIHNNWHTKTGLYILLATILVINDILSETYYYIISGICTIMSVIVPLAILKEEKKEKLLFVVCLFIRLLFPFSLFLFLL